MDYEQRSDLWAAAGRSDGYSCLPWAWHYGGGVYLYFPTKRSLIRFLNAMY